MKEDRSVKKHLYIFFCILIPIFEKLNENSPKVKLIMNTFLRLSTVLSFAISFYNCSSFAQEKEKYAAQIDSIVKTANPAFNGVILIIKNGKNVYTKAHGLANFESKKALKTDSQFEIMSNTRQITAVLILKEVEQGKIDLQSPIKKYLPQLTQSWADSVTVHQLLNHTHGIIDVEKPLLFKPGTEFKYGDLGYSLLGQIIENTTQKKYSEIADAFFKTLKMKNTFCYDKGKNQQLVSGYENTNNTFKKVSISKITPESIASNGIVSTAEDLAIWNKNLHKGKLLQPASYTLLFKYSIKAQHSFFGEEKEGYGYGFRIIENQPKKYVGHTGLGDGYSSVNIYYPTDDVSMIVLQNQMNAEKTLFYATEIQIRDLLLKSNLMN